MEGYSVYYYGNQIIRARVYFFRLDNVLYGIILN
jgi:hypothetical protein